MKNNVRCNLKRVFKLIFFLILEVFILFVLNYYLDAITISNFNSLFLIIVLLSLFNVILWPILSYISLKFIVFTLGFGTFLIDGILLWIISNAMDGFIISGFSLFTIPLLIGLINSFLSILFSMDIEDSYNSQILKNQLKRANKHVKNKDGYLFIEIDGLSSEVLKEALEKNVMPNLKSLIDSTHKMISWQTDLSSQTGSSQAGILHGNNNNLVAFRWVEKKNNNKIMSSNSLNDAEEIERRISDSNGLLSVNGASRSNLFSGDASDSLLTYSKLGSYSNSWYYLYSMPYNITRILILFIFDMIMELFSRIRFVVLNIHPRIHRGLKYFVARAGANVVMREATTLSLMGDIYASRCDVIYSTYMGYDEIAHHSGIRDFDSLYALGQIDKQFKHIINILNQSRRKYNLIILSDHGQSQGPTFKQKYGKSLNQLIQENIPKTMKIHSILHSNDDHFSENFKIKPYVKHNKERIDKKIDNTKDNVLGQLDEVKIKISSRYDNTINNLSNHYDDKKESILNKYDLSKEYLSYGAYKINDYLSIDELKSINFIKDKKPIVDRISALAKEYNINIDLSNSEIVSKDNAKSIVLSSGNLGLIYFTDWSERMTYEQIEDAFPNLISNLANHPGIGFVMVNSSIFGSMILSDDNIYYLNEDKLVGEDFLKHFGKNIISKLKRTDSFEHVPDILVNSAYDYKKDEVYAFEELIGSHGGAGGLQQEPFIVCPRSWEIEDDIFGAENVYKFFKRNID